MDKRICTFEDCGRKHCAKGLCSWHYNQQRAGKPLTKIVRSGSKPSAATRDEFFWNRVIKSDGCWAWTGSKTVLGYGHLQFQGLTTAAHRHSYELAFGPIEPGKVIDHICHNANCVNPEHLRMATHTQNMQNRSGAHSHSRSGIRGVRWDPRKKRWLAVVKAGGKVVFRGSFDSSEAAEAAVVAARSEFHT